jgi:hypothetical protein
MFRRGKVVWSPVEEDFLKAHRSDMTENQLSLALAKSRNAIKRKCGELDGKPIGKNMGRRSVIGKRDDLGGQFFRSNWESDFARWLNYRKKEWTYEPDVFSFLEHGVKRGTISYCPDFKVGTLYIEVKGYLDGRGRTAIRRFKKYYPEKFKKLRAVVGSPGSKADEFFKELGVPIYAYMNALNKEFKSKLPNWE